MNRIEKWNEITGTGNDGSLSGKQDRQLCDPSAP